jgi:hypothetical protein
LKNVSVLVTRCENRTLLDTLVVEIDDKIVIKSGKGGRLKLRNQVGPRVENLFAPLIVQKVDVFTPRDEQTYERQPQGVKLTLGAKFSHRGGTSSPYGPTHAVKTVLRHLEESGGLPLSVLRPGGLRDEQRDHHPLPGRHRRVGKVVIRQPRLPGAYPTKSYKY